MWAHVCLRRSTVAVQRTGTWSIDASRQVARTRRWDEKVTRPRAHACTCKARQHAQTVENHKTCNHLQSAKQELQCLLPSASDSYRMLTSVPRHTQKGSPRVVILLLS